MKPIVLVDKSFIQSLSVKEAHTLKTHFRILITPILLQEMITDIEKYKDDFEKALEQLRILAGKVGGGGQLSITDARILFHASLDGCRFGTKPGIPVFNPSRVKEPDGSIGCIIEETFEEELIRKWQSKEISDEDIKAAQNHYKGFLEYYSVNHHQELAAKHPLNNRFTHLEDLITFIDSISLEAKEAPNCVESVSRMTRTPIDLVIKAKSVWEKNGKSYFKSVFPYAFYYTRLFVIYSLGLTNCVIPASHRSNAVTDIQYFLYLPFCHAFCSQDRFHEESFKYFQRPEQLFIWGPDFKRDLAEITSFFNNLSHDEHINYSRLRGFYPPPLPNSISVNIWSEVFGPWDEAKFGNHAVDMSEEENKEMIDYIKELLKKSK